MWRLYLLFLAFFVDWSGDWMGEISGCFVGNAARHWREIWGLIGVIPVIKIPCQCRGCCYVNSSLSVDSIVSAHPWASYRSPMHSSKSADPPATPSSPSSEISDWAFFKSSAEMLNPASLAIETTASSSAALSFPRRLVSPLTFSRKALSCSSKIGIIADRHQIQHAIVYCKYHNC